MAKPEEKVAIVVSTLYNENTRTITVQMVIDERYHLGMDFPHTMFEFKPGMDIDAEMRKTAKLMRGKPIKILFTGEEECEKSK